MLAEVNKVLAGFVRTTGEGKELGIHISDKPIIGNASAGAWLVAWVWCFQITEMLLFIGNIFDTMERDWQKERGRVE